MTATERIAPPPRPGNLIERYRATHLQPGDGVSTIVTMPTLHNWVEQVYKAFGVDFPTGANERVLLGVRESSRSAAEGQADTYGSGSRPGDSGSLTAKGGGMVVDGTTGFNDLLFLVWTTSTPEEETSARVYRCTVDPGGTESTLGTPYLLEGKLYETEPCTHGRRAIPARRIYTGGSGSVLLARERTKRHRVFSRVEHGLVRSGAERGRFIETEANGTIHIHPFWNGYNADLLVKNWSTGCTVLGHDADSSVYTDFKSQMSAAANGSAVPYLVVASRYIHLPDAWARLGRDDPKALEDPKTVLNTTGLVRAPAGYGYLPSILGASFGSDVLAFASAVETVLAGLTNPTLPGLSSAIDRVLDERDGFEGLRTPDRLERFRAAVVIGEPASPEDAAGITTVLAPLPGNLRASLRRACFNTVIPAAGTPH